MANKGNIPKDIRESANLSFGTPITEAGRDSKNCYMAGMIDERANGKLRLLSELKKLSDSIYVNGKCDYAYTLIKDRIGEIENE